MDQRREGGTKSAEGERLRRECVLHLCERIKGATGAGGDSGVKIGFALQCFLVLLFFGEVVEVVVGGFALCSPQSD